MARSAGSRHSIFSQRLDRAVFAAYFLGGILPVGALAWVVNYHVLPQADRLETLGWVGGLLALGALSLGVYFALRRVTGGAVARMDADNRRLAALLGASRELAVETHADLILERLATHADAVLPSATPALLWAGRGGKELELGGPGAAALTGHLEALRRLGEDAVAAGRPSSDAGLVAAPFGRPGAARGAVLMPEDVESETVDAVATLARMAGTAIERGDLADAQRNFFVHVTDLLVSALDAHVVGREGHASQVARLANRIGRALHLDADRMERLHFASLLHDIGMLKIPPERHRDPKSVRTHPVIGSRMLARIRLWEPVAPIVQAHHEWMDGHGYPEGRSGDEIPLEARVLAVADAVDAMVRTEGTRIGRDLDGVVEELRRMRGTQFDPEVVGAFVGLAERDEIEI